MKTWYQSNRLGIAGVLACLLLGGTEVANVLSAGAMSTEANTPLGLLARAVASQFSPAPSLLRAGSDRAVLTLQLLLWAQCAVLAAYACLLWLHIRLPRGSTARAWVQALQMALALLPMSALLYALAAQHAVTMPLRQGLKWLAAQIVLLALILVYVVMFGNQGLSDHYIRMIWMFGGLGILIQLITFGMGYLAVSERRARLALAAANASLLATQAMLADTARASERMRIARDLHDAIGHHLTALNLHLDLAVRQAGDSPPEALRTSRELSRGLLDEVRGVVSTERSEQHIDLRSAIDTLCSGIPSPVLRVQYDECLDITSPVLAHTLFFCIQEALTNIMRHAQAALVIIDVRRDGAGVKLEIGDDGRGARGAAEGNGLRGMRERVAALGGTLRVASAATGMLLSIDLPLAGRLA
ncbi:MAG: histidine kinase [Pseudomonadota bacterium]